MTWESARLKRRVTTVVVVAAIGSIAAVGMAEVAHRLGHRFASDVDGGVRCAVLILGVPSAEDGRPHPIQRKRVSAGVAAFRRHSCDRIVVSGGPVGNAYIEAEVMAGLAVEHGVAAERIVTEPRARNTWENVEYSLPLLDGYERILITSNSLHAHRARRYFCRQAPGGCDRVRVASRYQAFADPGEKVFMTGYELAAWIRDLLFH